MVNRWVESGNLALGAAWRESGLRRWGEARPASALLLASLVVAAFCTGWLLLQRPNFFSGYDFLRLHYFYKAYFREAVLGGRLPLWNPYIGLGRPFLADMETASLYPPNLLILPLGVFGGVALAVLLHMALAMYSGVRLGQTLGASAGASWLLGAGIVLSSPLSARLEAGMVEAFFCLCWWPTLLWLGASLQDRWCRSQGVGFAVTVAGVILAGHPAMAFLEFLGLAAFLAFRQSFPADRVAARASAARLAALLGLGILGLGLAAAQLLPFVELVGQGNRPLHSDASYATAFGMLPVSWIFLLVPASGSLNPNWEQNLHCGVLPFFAALGGLFYWRDRNMRALLGLGTVGALMAAGDRTPFLGWLAHLVPGIAALRLPSRYGIWCATAVLGAGALILSRPARRPHATVGIGLATCAVALALLIPYAAAGPSGAARFFLVQFAPMALAAGLVLAWHRRADWPWAAGVLALLIAADCGADWLLAIQWQSPLYAENSAPPYERPVRDLLVRQGLLGAGKAPPRISFNPGDVRENDGMVEKFSSYNSYSAPDLGRVWNYLHVATGAPLSAIDFSQLPVVIYDRLALLDSLDLVSFLDHRSHALLFISQPDARAYLTFQTQRVPDWRAAEERMTVSRDFHLRALVEEGSAPDDLATVGHPRGTAAVVDFRPERVQLRVAADASAVLVVGEAWYPGWTARVDGRTARVFPVNGWMRGVAVGAGSHDVVMDYHQDYLTLGLALGAASALALAGLARFGPRGQAVSRIL